MITERISSLKEVAEITRQEGHWSYPLRDFLDGFQAEPAWEKLADAPAFLVDDLQDDGLADAYLAAVADSLCRLHRYRKPEWIVSPSRTLKKPWFAAETHGLRMIYLQESPSAFRERNIFVSANTLTRV